MDIGKPVFRIEKKLKEYYPNLDNLLKIIDIQYLTSNYVTLGKSCPIQVSEVYRLEHEGIIHKSKIGLFPIDRTVNSIWYGLGIRRAVRKGIIELGLAYDTECKHGPNVRFNLTNSSLRRLLFRLTKFPRKQEIGVYLQPKKV